eukprot:TRINITY_DN1268_c0_g1_i1.p1 TRINITY_DN1268_c0_g1~~TRINITY_DN1268_c0_g1_i1.p1  ORF type:complete len:431 (-),score=114.22 TRINITY_DN1268_c0_g1_i1:302-1594(-)
MANNNNDEFQASVFDLTGVISKYLDKHLVLPLVKFLEGRNIYSEQELLEQKFRLVSKTNMADLQKDIYETLHKGESYPDDGKRETVVNTLKTLQKQCKPMLTLISNQELVEQLIEQNNYNSNYIKENHKILDEDIDTLYKFAKFQYDCGLYKETVNLLNHYLLICNEEQNEQYFNALWGKLAAQILLQEWNDALEDMNVLKEAIDLAKFGNLLQQLQQRTWLIHWSLFIFFNHPNGNIEMIDFFFQERYLNTIQTNCPHIFRYLATALITNKKKKASVKELVKVLEQEQTTYTDPVTNLLECLYINFDFDGAQQKLRECEQLLENDFFLNPCREEFIENARLSIFETYCRIHNCIDLGMISEKLNMDKEQAEHWIVNLIRNARLDAKIDLEKGYVVMRSQHPSVYQQIIDKTKNLQYRTQYINANLKQVL